MPAKPLKVEAAVFDRRIHSSNENAVWLTTTYQNVSFSADQTFSLGFISQQLGIDLSNGYPAQSRVYRMDSNDDDLEPATSESKPHLVRMNLKAVPLLPGKRSAAAYQGMWALEIPDPLTHWQLVQTFCLLRYTLLHEFMSLTLSTDWPCFSLTVDTPKTSVFSMALSFSCLLLGSSACRGSLTP